MLEKLKYEDFDSVFEIMKNSFPEDEYRDYKEQKALLDNSLYQIYVFYEEGVKAFISVWDFEKIVYVEHFAVDKSCRNRGLGGKILEELQSIFNKRICLEVEPPESEMAIRRKEFYERNNFYFNEYDYMQPPMMKGKKSIPLFIMTTAGGVSEEEFKQIRDLLYSKVYKYNIE